MLSWESVGKKLSRCVHEAVSRMEDLLFATVLHSVGVGCLKTGTYEVPCAVRRGGMKLDGYLPVELRPSEPRRRFSDPRAIYMPPRSGVKPTSLCYKQVGPVSFSYRLLADFKSPVN